MRPKRITRVPAAKKKVVYNFGRYRAPLHKGTKGYAALASGTSSYGKGYTYNVGYVTGRKRREEKAQKEQNRKVAKYLEIVDKKKERSDAKSKLKSICSNTMSKHRRKLNAEPWLKKIRNQVPKNKKKVGVCHRKEVPDRSVLGTKTVHRVLTRYKRGHKPDDK